MQRTIIRKLLFVCAIFNVAIQLSAETFKLATWNILSQVPYEHYAFTSTSGKKTIAAKNMPQLWARKDRFDAIIKHLSYLIKNGVDIICLQEINLDEKNEFQPIFDFFKTQNYSICSFKKTDDEQRVAQTTCVAYNPQKFDEQTAQCRSFYTGKDLGRKAYSAATLELKEYLNGPKINVMSLHLPFNPKETDPNPSDNVQDFKELMQMKTLTTTLKKLFNKNSITIICGDFNWSTTAYYYQFNDALKNTDQRFITFLNNAYSSLKNTLNDTTGSSWFDAAKIKQYSAPTGNQGWGTLETIDYVWYTNPTSFGFKCTNFYQIPEFNYKNADEYFDKLVKHGYPLPHATILIEAQKSENTNKKRTELLLDLKTKALQTGNKITAYTDFPSDHAILIAEFEVDTSKLVKKQSSSSLQSLDRLAQSLTSLT